MHRRIAAGAVLAAALTTGVSVQGSAASGGAWLSFTSDRTNAQPGQIVSLGAGTAPRPLTGRPFASGLLDVSPVGDEIAYASASAVGSIVLARADGSGRRVVALAPGHPTGTASFSPDGKRLLATWYGSSLNAHTLVVDAASGRRRALGGASNRCNVSPTWLGATGLLTCIQVTHGVRRTYVLDDRGRVRASIEGVAALTSRTGMLAGPPSGRATTVYDARGKVIRRYPGAALAWSPDGRLLALARRGALTLVEPADGKTVRAITGPSSWQPYPVAGGFTPDGADFAYSGPRWPTMLTLATGATRRLPQGAFEGAWSHDERLAYLRFSGTNATIEIGDRYGAHARSAGTFPFDGHGDNRLVWPVSGSRVLYSWSIRSHQDLWRMRTDGSSLQQLTRGNEISSPTWSPDGSRLAYASARFEDDLCGYCDSSIVIADATGKPLSTVPRASDNDVDYAPSWSSDGTRLAVSHGFSGAIDVVGVDGSGRITVGQEASSAAWSPDGTTIAIPSSQQVIGVRPDGTGSHVLVTLPGDIHPSSVAWSPDGRLLAVSAEKGVYVAAADGTSPPRLVTAASEPSRASFSPDGSLLTFAADVKGPIPGTRHIVVVGIDGSGLHALAASPYHDDDPVFAPGP